MNTDYYRQRRTLRDDVTREGIGIHTGESTAIRLQPAETGSGLRLIRVDRDPPVEFRPRVSNVHDSSRSTVLESGGETLHTVEHLLATLYGLGVTDCRVEVDGPEIPALDGSAAGFVEAINEVDLKRYKETRSIYRVQDPMYVEAGDGLMVVLPSSDFKVSCTIDFDNEAIGQQFRSFTMDPESFARDIAPARTFGFMEEVEDLLERDLARGGSLENALVVDEQGNLVGDDPQFADEFVRHKILDIVGDLALVEDFLVGHVVAIKSGHELHRGLAHEIRDRVEVSATGREKQYRGKGDHVLDIDRIREILPHRYPFLLLDRILSMDYENEKAVGIKNVTMNEPFFRGHFPDDPVMPGVLILEAIAQLGGAWVLKNPRTEGKNSYFMGVDNVKWRRPVRPGDQLVIECEGKRIRTRTGVMEGRAYVNGELAAEGEFKFALVDR